MVYEYFPNVMINIQSLVQLPFLVDMGEDQAASDILESWLTGEEYKKHFNNSDSYFTISPDLERFAINIDAYYISVICEVGIMSGDDIIDFDLCKFIIKDNKIIKFLYLGEELD